jgi:hypothetical protein
MSFAIFRSFKLIFIAFLVTLGTNTHAAPSVLIETSQGSITIELYPEKALHDSRWRL